MSDQSLPDLDFGDLFGNDEEPEDNGQGGFVGPVDNSSAMPDLDTFDWDDDEDESNAEVPKAPVKPQKVVGTQTPEADTARRQGATYSLPEPFEDESTDEEDAGSDEDDDILALIDDLSSDDSEDAEDSGDFWNNFSVDEEFDDEPGNTNPPASEKRETLPGMSQLLGEGMFDGLTDEPEDDVIEEFSWDDDEEDDSDEFEDEIDHLGSSANDEFEEEFSEEDMFATQSKKSDEKSEIKSEPKKKEKKEKPVNPDGTLIEKLKKKFGEFKSQAAAEFRGEDGPSEQPTQPLNDETSGRLAIEAPKGKGGLSALIAKIFKPYTLLAGFLLKLITSLLEILSKIPLVGIPFKLLLGLTKPLSIISNLVPLLILVGAVVGINIIMIPSSSEITLPDNGSATFSGFGYDKGTNSAFGTVANNGEIIANVKSNFTVFSYNPKLSSPKSWVLLQEQAACSSGDARVDIDSELKITAKCNNPVEGFAIKVSGELNE